MLCFKCGSYCPDDSTQCGVCSQSFLDDQGKPLGRIEAATTTANIPASIFVVGERVADRYKVSDVIGYGGVGIVYRAKDDELDTTVALKGISPNLLQTPVEQKAFHKTMRASRKLHHPNIVRVFGTGEEGSRRFFTMELLDGLSLQKIIKLRHSNGESFTAEEVVPIFEQLGSALDYAHRTTWHGNLKPENILVLPEVLKITDFNLVKALPLKPFLATAKSKTSGFPYVAPELRKEAAKISGSADIYSLGVILGKMLTGIVFEGHFPKQLKDALEALPPEVETVFRKSVAESPQNRYATAGDMARALETALNQAPAGFALPVPAGTGKSGDVMVEVTPPPPPMETDPGSGHAAPPLEEVLKPRDYERTVKASVVDDTTMMEEEWMAEPPVLAQAEAKFPEFTQEEPDEGPPAAPMTSDGERPAIPLDDNDEALSEEGFAALQSLGASNDELTAIDEPVSEEDWLARNPTLADALSETSAPIKAIPTDETRTLEVDLGPVGDADLDGADPLPPVLPVSLPPTPAASIVAQPRGQVQPKEGMPSWAMGVGGTLAVAALVFFVLTSQDNDIPQKPVSFSDAQEVVNQEPPAVPTNEPAAPPASEPRENNPTTPTIENPATKTEPQPPADSATPSVQNEEAPEVIPATSEKATEPAVTEPTPTPKAPEPIAAQPEATKAPKETTPPPPKPETKVAAAAPSADAKCPKGMKKISEGGFKFGSLSSDPMRNFGEKLLSSRKTHAYCIDYYEYPNGAKAKPRVGVSWNKAKTSCESKGKRLCTELEWERACKGPNSSRFPYGNAWNSKTCNTENEEGIPGTLARAYDFKKCRSGYRVYMMAGNAEEWTADSYAKGSGNKVVKGGAANRPDWASRCAARRAQNPRTSATLLGFRCCADPQ